VVLYHPEKLSLYDRPPSSMMDSTMSPRMKITKGEKLGCVPWFATL